MGKEWRVFLPSTAQAFDNHRNTQEKRVDTYIVFEEDNSIGLKLRGNSRNSFSLELKIRTKVTKNGIEKWSKVLSEPLDGILCANSDQMSMLQHLELQELSQIDSNVIKCIIGKLDAYDEVYNKNNSKTIVSKCIQYLKNGNFTVFYMEKRRNQKWNALGMYNREKTWIKYSFSSCSKIHTGYAKSVCCEGKSHLFKRAKHYMTKQSFSNLECQGYPRFCAQQICLFKEQNLEEKSE